MERLTESLQVVESISICILSCTKEFEKSASHRQPSVGKHSTDTRHIENIFPARVDDGMLSSYLAFFIELYERDEIAVALLIRSLV